MQNSFPKEMCRFHCTYCKKAVCGRDVPEDGHCFCAGGSSVAERDRDCISRDIQTGEKTFVIKSAKSANVCDGACSFGTSGRWGWGTDLPRNFQAIVSLLEVSLKIRCDIATSIDEGLLGKLLGERDNGLTNGLDQARAHRIQPLEESQQQRPRRAILRMPMENKSLSTAKATSHWNHQSGWLYSAGGGFRLTFSSAYQTTCPFRGSVS